MEATRRTRLPRAERQARALPIAETQGGVAHRRALARVGVSRADVRSEVAAGRWAVHGRHTVSVGTGPLTTEARRWQAVWESGSGAVLDGVAALQAWGLEGFSTDRLDVSLPHSSRGRRVEGVTGHRRRTMPAAVSAGVPRVRAVPAVLHAASWAVSDRQAALVLCMVVQQRLVRPADLLAAAAELGRCRRGRLTRVLVRDICDGAHSLGELDFGRLCRNRGLPEPSRQAVRTTPDGRVYLDAAWPEIGLVVEIDGGHHASALGPVDDALRQNELVLGGEPVLRIPVIGLRLTPDAFMDQVVRAHARFGVRAA